MPAFRWLLVALALLALPAQVSAQQVEAYSGAPFGVLRITVNNNQQGGEWLDLYDDQGRLLYPASQAAGQPVRRIIRNIIGRSGPRVLTQYALFHGNAPLRVRIGSPDAAPQDVRVVSNAASHRTQLDAWWRAFRAPTRFWNKSDEYPPQLESYLTTMLARRLKQPIEPRLFKLFEDDQLEQVLGPLLGTEASRLTIERDIMLGKYANAEQATFDLPAAIDGRLEVPELLDEIKIERMAEHVPAECFYVRFGNYVNFTWINLLMEKAGGEARHVTSTRGVDYGIRPKIERQLALKQDDLAKAFGKLVISDIALIGTDTFLREGAAIGILFEGRGERLAEDLRRQRQEVRDQEPTSVEETLTLAGQPVEYLSTPDGRVRSYYAISGNYHLVTTSRTIARRFLEASSGDRPLAAAQDFRYARSQFPLKRRDAVFVYFSEDFLRGFAGPATRIEMTRRLQAEAELELVEMAQLAARAEGHPHATIEELVAGKFLPEGFGQRPDGSRTELLNGVAVDTLRGQRGYFVPTIDLPPQKATGAEVAAYQSFSDSFNGSWKHLSPIVIGVKRRAAEGANRDHVDVDMRMSPLALPQYQQLLKWLGPPSDTQIEPVPGDLAHLDLMLSENRIFGALRDVGPAGAVPRELPENFTQGPIMGLLTTQPRSYLTGYVGASPQLGVLRWLDSPAFPPPDAAGYSALQGLLGPVWRSYTKDMTVFSFHGDLLHRVAPQLAYTPAERPAQARLRVRDLADTQVGSWFHLFAFGRAWRASNGNARFLTSLEQQLRVPRAECLATAERLLAARLVCPLGGEYVVDDRHREWVSTAWDGQPQGKPPAIPVGYRGPILDWLRQLEADLSFNEQALEMHAEIEMQFDERTKPSAEMIPPPAPDQGPDAGIELLPLPADPQEDTLPEPNGERPGAKPTLQKPRPGKL